MHFSESVHVNTKLDFDNLDLIFKVTPALCYVNFRPKYGFCKLSLEPNNGFGQFIYTRDVFYVRREVDLVKTAKVNAYIMHIFGKIELLSIHAT